MKKRRCANSRECKQDAKFMAGLTPVCSTDCAIIVGSKKVKKAKVEREKEFKRETKRRKDASRTRTQLYKDLEDEIRWWAKHVEYKGQPCFTCGKPQKPTDSGGAFHAGHYRSVGSCKDLRHELRNIRIQCFSCNSANSGMRKEYAEEIVRALGQGELDWLDGPHTPLKDVFPTTQDIRDEIAVWRQKIRDHKKTNS